MSQRVSKVGHHSNLFLARRELADMQNKLVRSDRSDKYFVKIEDSGFEGDERYVIWLMKH